MIQEDEDFMRDYAKEIAIETYNIFYEIEDIVDKYDLAMEADVPAQSAPAPSASQQQSSTPTNNAPTNNSGSSTDKPADTKKDDNKNPATDNDAKKAEGQPVTNTDVKNSSKFVSKVKEVMQKLADVVKASSAKSAQRLARIQSEKISESLKRVTEAKSEGAKINEITIENNDYHIGVITSSAQMVSQLSSEMSRTITEVSTMYTKTLDGSTPSEEFSKKIESLNQRYGAGGIFSYAAKQLKCKTTDNADAKSILKEFQDGVRGEKKSYTINQAYADEIEKKLRELVNTTQHAQSLLQQIKSDHNATEKNIMTATQRVEMNKSNEANKSMSSFVTDVGKFNSFVSQFCVMAFTLTEEAVINSKITLDRAYGLDMVSKAKDTVKDIKGDGKKKKDGNDK